MLLLPLADDLDLESWHALVRDEATVGRFGVGFSAVLAVTEDEDVRHRLGAAALARVAERFGLDQQGAALARVYDAAAGVRTTRAIGRAS